MNDAAVRPRFPWGATVAAAIVFAICCGLGVWQLQRKAEKSRDVARDAAMQHATPAPLPNALAAAASGKDVNFMRVTATCPGLDRAPFAELYAIADGRPGVRLISACRSPAAGYDGVLVDRGFIDGDVKARPVADNASVAPVTIAGVLRAPGKANAFTPKHGPKQPLWFSRDVAGIAGQLGFAKPAPVMLIAQTSSNPGMADLRQVALPTEVESHKGEYAPTWFGLALVLAAFYAAFVTQRLRGKKA
ncbi:MAG TPA: SURF1 family cytochrome oxidase biogenesis protein [Caulobacteraceae bacterium]|jgi:surfeit locus 1 family protein|nr:SURF1 family cytochrome oxidase biogenesis protein [Caulobacteraceae bacterium]